MRPVIVEKRHIISTMRVIRGREKRIRERVSQSADGYPDLRVLRFEKIPDNHPQKRGPWREREEKREREGR